MIKFLLILPLVLLLFSTVIVLVSLFNLFAKNIKPIVDSDYKCLDGPSSLIRDVSTKYAYRIRGSVRLSQGRIKSIDELIEIKSKIMFP